LGTKFGFYSQSYVGPTKPHLLVQAARTARARVLAVARNVAGGAAGRADDAGGDVGRVHALPGLVRVGAAVGAAAEQRQRQVVAAQRAVEERQLPELLFAEVVLRVGQLHRRPDRLLDLSRRVISLQSLTTLNVLIKINWFQTYFGTTHVSKHSYNSLNQPKVL